ncbi:MAG TPA: hypothetical protein VIR29_10635 [Anseongella sp.]
MLKIILFLLFVGWAFSREETPRRITPRAPVCTPVIDTTGEPVIDTTGKPERKMKTPVYTIVRKSDNHDGHRH